MTWTRKFVRLRFHVCLFFLVEVKQTSMNKAPSTFFCFVYNLNNNFAMKIIELTYMRDLVVLGWKYIFCSIAWIYGFIIKLWNFYRCDGVIDEGYKAGCNRASLDRVPAHVAPKETSPLITLVVPESVA